MKKKLLLLLSGEIEYLIKEINMWFKLLKDMPASRYRTEVKKLIMKKNKRLNWLLKMELMLK